MNDSSSNFVQSLPVVPPQQAGLLDAGVTRLDDAMRREVASKRLPGGLILIARGGKIGYRGEFGFLRPDGPAMRGDAIFRIYSMTKPITAVALMMLAEEGKIGLDDLVAAHIPSWKNLRVYASGIPSLVANTAGQFITLPPKRRMKVIDLVTHTSGLTYGFMSRTSVDA